MSFYINNFSWKFQVFPETNNWTYFYDKLIISAKYVGMISSTDDMWCFQQTIEPKESNKKVIAYRHNRETNIKYKTW